ncbi:hypothetical protein B9G79_01160 [Bdellovibrio bacteriovorus]|uniref:DEAD/DEAH box helicase n=2 Tax=Bdellovibrio bacteriovorus TaxID=959 RepID=A0A1Z3N478_BDEBC|nr:hypothetical protein B9G79_01160 [Bdellovibrio bacteriovorus]
MPDITFTTLRKKDGDFTAFRELYTKLLLNQQLDEFQLQKLLQIAIVFLNSKRELVRFFGYRIILQYALAKNDFTALNDISLNLGYIPISKILEKTSINSEFQGEFFKEFLSSYKNSFRTSAGTFLTEGQRALQRDLFDKKKDSNNVVIAPTSYGKSEAIVSTALEVPKSCIIVPTKALLAQTKKRFLNSGADLSAKTIIIHHEMYSPSQDNLIAILTQERLLSLLQENPKAYFDKVYVDEAHNLLEKDSRANLLASCLVLLKYRNKNTVFNFFTPFLNDARNLETKFLSLNAAELRKNEYIKSEKIFLIDFRRSDEALLHLYDQFMNEFIEIPEATYRSDVEFINRQAAHKNIIYFNTPKDVESYCSQLIKSRPLITSDFVSKAYESIKNYIHKDYFLLRCLSRGIVYHHGSMPDNVKLYIEQLYIEEPQIQFIVTTSTLLEGVNIPADQIFIMSTSKGIRDLSSSQFKNLIGRVCRYGDIFSGGNPENLQKLMPKIFLLGTEYSRSKYRGR